ncbi:MAG: 4-diphosphocytidyl-2C-methyl-D-erythritol kinase, partial [Rhodoplanes sp.]
MKFGAVPLAEAKGGIVVHAIRQDGIVLKKGAVIGDAEINALRAAGLSAITVARIEAGDVPEDVAAAEVAAAAAGDGIHVDRAFTGRANLFAEAAGVLVVDKAGVDRLNAADPDITFATLSPFAPVVAGTMIATVKIIPFAVSAAARDRALAAAQADAPLVRVAPYRLRKIGVISTVL